MQRLKKIFDISSSVKGEIVQPVLSIRIGEKYFCYAVSAYSSGECRDLSYWTNDEISADSVSEILQDDKALNHSFYQVKICYDYSGNTLVPGAGFRHEDANLFKLNVPGSTATITEKIGEWQLYNVYRVPKGIHDLLTRKFPSARCWHHATVGLQFVNTALPEGYIQLDIRHHDFYVLAVKAGRLLTAQSFEYNNPEDVIYYLLKICRHYSLSQSEVQVGLSGLVERESPLFKELYQYFGNLHLREAEWKPAQNIYPLHFFTTLNDLAKCAS